MKLVKGHTLTEILANRKSLSEGLPRLLSIFESICQTMAYAHARGVIHRDLKPSNVMVGSFGEVQVMDWGLAKVLPRGGVVDDASAGHTKEQATLISTARSGTDSDLSQAGSVMGTPAYMAPEQARGEVEEVDERADVFALGSIFCELLTGQPAFSGRNSGEILRKAARGDLAEAVTRLDQADLCHDPELVALAKSCLSSERDDRPRHAGEIAERMSLYHSRVQERLRQSEIERAEAKARAEEATKRATVERQRLRLTVALAASLLGLMVLGGSAGFWVYQQRQTRLTSLEATLSRIQTLREQAAADGAESPRRREAIVAADLALASLSDLSQSEPGLRLNKLRDELTSEQEPADRGQKLLADMTGIKLTNVGSESEEKSWERADHLFSEAFRRLQLDLDTNSEAAVVEIRKIPAHLLPSLVNNLDRWLMIRHQLAEPEKRSMHGILNVIRSLDADPERNQLRSLLLESDLKPFLKSLQDTANRASLLDSGPEMPLVLSRLLAQAEDTETATAVLRKSVIRYPGDLATNIELARNLEAHDECIKELREAVRCAPLDGEYHQALGVALRATNDKVGAIVEFREAVRLETEVQTEKTEAQHPTTADVVLDQLDSRTAGYFQGGLMVLTIFHQDPNWAMTNEKDLHELLSEVLAETGDFSGAIEAYREGIQRQPEKPELHEGLARLLKSRGLHDEANVEFNIVIESIREYLQSKPDDVQRTEHLSELLEQRGETDESVAVYRDAIKVQPKSTELHHGLAELLERQSKIPESEVELDQVIVLLREQLQSKEEPWILQELGMTLLRRGQRQDAVAQFRRIVELDPKASDACNNIAWALATNQNTKLRDGEIAVEFATKACELTEWKNASFIDTLAAACAESSDFDAAVKWQTKAIELSSNEKEKEDLGARLKLYQDKQPFHSASPPD